MFCTRNANTNNFLRVKAHGALFLVSGALNMQNLPRVVGRSLGYAARYTISSTTASNFVSFFYLILSPFSYRKPRPNPRAYSCCGHARRSCPQRIRIRRLCFDNTNAPCQSTHANLTIRARARPRHRRWRKQLCISLLRRAVKVNRHRT